MLIVSFHAAMSFSLTGYSMMSFFVWRSVRMKIFGHARQSKRSSYRE